MNFKRVRFLLIYIMLINVTVSALSQNAEQLLTKEDSLKLITHEKETTISKMNALIYDLENKQIHLTIKKDNLNQHVTYFSVVLAVVSVFITVIGIIGYTRQKSFAIKNEKELDTIKNIKKEAEETQKEMRKIAFEFDNQLETMKYIYAEYRAKYEKLNKTDSSVKEMVTEMINDPNQPPEEVKKIEEVKTYVREKLKNDDEISTQKITEIYMKANLDRANHAFYTKDWAIVVTSINPYLGYSPSDFEAFYKYGHSYLMLSEYEQAKQAFENVLGINPSHCESTFGLLACYKKIKPRNDEKIEELKERLVSIGCDDNENPFSHIK